MDEIKHSLGFDKYHENFDKIMLFLLLSWFIWWYIIYTHTSKHLYWRKIFHFVCHRLIYVLSWKHSPALTHLYIFWPNKNGFLAIKVIFIWKDQWLNKKLLGQYTHTFIDLHSATSTYFKILFVKLNYQPWNYR